MSSHLVHTQFSSTVFHFYFYVIQTSQLLFPLQLFISSPLIFISFSFLLPSSSFLSPPTFICSICSEGAAGTVSHFGKQVYSLSCWDSVKLGATFMSVLQVWSSRFPQRNLQTGGRPLGALTTRSHLDRVRTSVWTWTSGVNGSSEQRRSSGSGSTFIWTSVEFCGVLEYCAVLWSTVQYCAVLWSTVEYCRSSELLLVVSMFSAQTRGWCQIFKSTKKSNKWIFPDVKLFL